jgi:hypothetical protein
MKSNKPELKDKCEMQGCGKVAVAMIGGNHLSVCQDHKNKHDSKSR